MNIEVEKIPELSIETMSDEQGSFILLEQDSSGNIDRVAIHAIHLRYMAEKFGLVETSDPQVARTIAKLTRQIRALNERVGHLAYYLVNHSDHKHADLDYERTYAMATADIAAEFCIDLDGTDPPPVSSQARSSLANANLATPTQQSLL